MTTTTGPCLNTHRSLRWRSIDIFIWMGYGRIVFGNQANTTSATYWNPYSAVDPGLEPPIIIVNLVHVSTIRTFLGTKFVL